MQHNPMLLSVIDWFTTDMVHIDLSLDLEDIRISWSNIIVNF